MWPPHGLSIIHLFYCRKMKVSGPGAGLGNPPLNKSSTMNIPKLCSFSAFHSTWEGFSESERKKEKWMIGLRRYSKRKRAERLMRRTGWARYRTSLPSDGTAPPFHWLHTQELPVSVLHERSLASSQAPLLFLICGVPSITKGTHISEHAELSNTKGW